MSALDMFSSLAVLRPTDVLVQCKSYQCRHFVKNNDTD